MKNTDHARLLSKGKSFEYSTWQEFVKYSNDCFKQDFVSIENALLVCKETHESNLHNKPILIYSGTQIIGCESEYWDFVMAGLPGEKGDKGESGNGNMGIGIDDPKQGYIGDIYLNLSNGDVYSFSDKWEKKGEVFIGEWQDD